MPTFWTWTMVIPYYPNLEYNVPWYDYSKYAVPFYLYIHISNNHGIGTVYLYWYCMVFCVPVLRYLLNPKLKDKSWLDKSITL